MQLADALFPLEIDFVNLPLDEQEVFGPHFVVGKPEPVLVARIYRQ